MELTNEMAVQYVGGQMEIQNSAEGYIFRGEIEDISIENDELTVKFKWLAQGAGFPPLPTKWVLSSHFDYGASLEIYTPSDIGENRLSLNSAVTGETAILYPPDGSKLDPAQVEGLDL